MFLVYEMAAIFPMWRVLRPPQFATMPPGSCLRRVTWLGQLPGCVYIWYTPGKLVAEAHSIRHEECCVGVSVGGCAPAVLHNRCREVPGPCVLLIRTINA